MPQIYTIIIVRFPYYYHYIDIILIPSLAYTQVA